MRKVLWKNCGRDRRGNRREEARVDRRQRRTEAMTHRRVGVVEAAQGGTKSNQYLVPTLNWLCYSLVN